MPEPERSSDQRLLIRLIIRPQANLQLYKSRKFSQFMKGREIVIVHLLYRQYVALTSGLNL